MYQLKAGEMPKIAPLFQNAAHTLIWSCLQGYMGRAWTDDIGNPVSACIITGDFCFLSGVPDPALVQNIRAFSPSGSLLVIPGQEAWEKLIESVWIGRFERFHRYAIKKEPDIFNRELLSANINRLPEKYTMRRIGPELYRKLLQTEQLKDLCSVFDSSDAWQKYGLGFVIQDGVRIISGASSYTVYDRGIEIEADTLPEYRRQGLALACASRLIIECQDRKLYPSWDAMNQESLALAGKLGYHFDREYVTYFVKTEEPPFI